jgi:hypothetical protein
MKQIIPFNAYLLTTAVADGSNSNSNNNNINNNKKLPLVWHKELHSESRGLTPAN